MALSSPVVRILFLSYIWKMDAIVGSFPFKFTQVISICQENDLRAFSIDSIDALRKY